MTIVWIVLAVIIISFGLVIFRGAPYVPSRRRYILQALTDLYPLSKSDTLVDIGSGDGVVLRVSSKLGANAIGLEINPVLFTVSRFLSWGDKKVSINLVDFRFSHLPENTTVVYAFSTSNGIKRIFQWLQVESNRIGIPVYLISYGFEIVGISEQKTVAAYHLYKLQPLHTE